MTENNLFQEVQEDLQRQRLEALWKRYAVWIGIAALVVVMATAGSTAYRSWRVERDQHLTAGLLDVSKADADVGKRIDALQKFAGDSAGTNQAVFALLKAGALAADQNDKAKAVQIFDMVAHDGKAELAFRQLGDLLAVQVQMDSGDAAALSARLQPLTEPHGAWRFSALEDQGYLALRVGDTDKARRIFTDLSQDAGVPQSMNGRATDILRSLN